MAAASIVCLDAAYGGNAAAAAAVLFPAWESGDITAVRTRLFPAAAAYEPGAFYKRELPLLLAILSDIEPAICAITIDGYVWLGPDGAAGLGAHLFRTLGGRVPVVGVAKTRFRGDTVSIPVTRNSSRRPLYVTAAGIDPQDAVANVARMHGSSRIPTALQRADCAARNALGSPPG